MLNTAHQVFTQLLHKLTSINDTGFVHNYDLIVSGVIKWPGFFSRCTFRNTLLCGCKVVLSHPIRWKHFKLDLVYQTAFSGIAGIGVSSLCISFKPGEDCGSSLC